MSLLNTILFSTLAVGAGVAIVGFTVEPNPPNRCSDKRGAYAMSQEFIAHRLLAPSTTDFPSYSEGMVTRSGYCAFNVNAYVDAQNASGVQMRTPYTATLLFNPDGTWSVTAALHQ